MKFYAVLAQLLIGAVTPAAAQAQSQLRNDPYVPVYGDCPSKLTVRDASGGLSDQETAWREARSEQVISRLGAYLRTANITDFDVGNFTSQLNSTNVPITGLSISGGGTQSGLGGLGIWQAYDARYPAAVSAGTGGLTQILYYITGLSGGGAVTVSEIATNNFSTVQEITQSVNYSVPYDAGRTGDRNEFFKQAFELVGGKAEAGFPVSVADTFGRFWANWVPQNSSLINYSQFARNDTTEASAFAVGDAPMPIIVMVEVVPGQSPEIGNIMYPGRNSTNGFDLTSYEVNPFEFGSWAGGRIQAFFPTGHLGTAMDNGTAQNDTQCVEGFDKLSLIQGTTTDAFIAYFLDSFYDVQIFAKRTLQTRQSSDMPNDVPIPQSEADNPLVQLVNDTASEFDLTFNQSLYGTYPNPFENYNDEMKDVSELLLVDGSLTGETNPIRPLIVPERDVDFIIVYEASSDAMYNWVNGTNLINTANSAREGNLSFPTIPTVKTMITQNLTKQPTFFGCNDSDITPLVLYLPNSPWTDYTNFTFRQNSFTENQVNRTFENSFQLATYGNGAVDPEWPACLACAAIRGSLLRLSIDIPVQCQRCFSRHCWDGRNSTVDVIEADMDPAPRLNSSLTYREWNATVWSVGAGSQEEGSSQDEEDRAYSYQRPGKIALSAIALAFLLTI